MGAHLAARARSLRGELSGVRPLARVCALRGLVAALPAPVLCAPLRWPAPSAPGPDSLGSWCAGAGSGGGERDASGTSGDGGNVELAGMCGTAGFGVRGVGSQGRRPEAAEWTLLSDGALPAAVAAMMAAPDANFKYHAAQLLLVCLQRLEACLLVRSLPTVPGTWVTTAQARACLPARWQLQWGVWQVHAVAGDVSACLCRLQWSAARAAVLLNQKRHPHLKTPALGTWHLNTDSRAPMQHASSTLGCAASVQGAAQQHMDGAACPGAEARRAHLRGVPGLAGLSALADAGAPAHRPRGEDAHAEDDDDLLYPDLSPDEPGEDELAAAGDLRHDDAPPGPPHATARGGGGSPRREQPHDERAGGGLRAAPDGAPAAPPLRPALRAQIMALLWTCWEVRGSAGPCSPPGLQLGTAPQ